MRPGSGNVARVSAFVYFVVAGQKSNSMTRTPFSAWNMTAATRPSSSSRTTQFS